MIKRLLVTILYLTCPVVGAVELPSPPSDQRDVLLDKYLIDVRKAMRNLEVETSNPDGSRRGLRGDLVFYNDSSGLRFCRNTSTTAEGGTTWACDAVTSATQACFEGSTENDFETCFSITDPTADRTITVPNADSTTVQSQTCSGTQKVSAISSAGIVTCSADQGTDAFSQWAWVNNITTSLSAADTYTDVNLTSNSLVTFRIYKPADLDTLDAWASAGVSSGTGNCRIVFGSVTGAGGNISGSSTSFDQIENGLDISAVATGWVSTKFQCKSSAVSTLTSYGYIYALR